jgi:hypothetical protein
VKVTLEMIEAARWVEFNHYRRGLLGAGLFKPTPDAVIRAMLEAALGDAPAAEEMAARRPLTR